MPCFKTTGSRGHNETEAKTVLMTKVVSLESQPLVLRINGSFTVFFRRKLFQTNNIEIVRACHEFFGFELPHLVLYFPSEWKNWKPFLP